MQREDERRKRTGGRDKRIKRWAGGRGEEVCAYTYVHVSVVCAHYVH